MKRTSPFLVTAMFAGHAAAQTCVEPAAGLATAGLDTALHLPTRLSSTCAMASEQCVGDCLSRPAEPSTPGMK